MTIRRNLTIATILATVGGMAAAVHVRAGADAFVLSAEYAKGVVNMTLERPENKQVRDYMTSQAAVDAAKKGAPLPDGTVVIVVQYAAQLDAQGNPAKDANGRLIKANNILR